MAEGWKIISKGSMYQLMSPQGKSHGSFSSEEEAMKEIERIKNLKNIASSPADGFFQNIKK